jgi:hypothetical protein
MFDLLHIIFIIDLYIIYVQWPPPPRSTPIIVPPHLRSTIGKQAADPLSLLHANGQPSGGTVKAKPRHKNSTLHNAVMDRLEIQQAMNEMGSQ